MLDFFLYENDIEIQYQGRTKSLCASTIFFFLNKIKLHNIFVIQFSLLIKYIKNNYLFINGACY